MQYGRRLQVNDIPWISCEADYRELQIVSQKTKPVHYPNVWIPTLFAIM